MLDILYFLVALSIVILVHEAGHMIVALLCGVKVEAFSIGFGKPLFHKKIKGIDFRFTPILVGGYTQLKGENDKSPDGFLAQPYWKKFLILIAGAFMNIILAFICYWINYKSIYLEIAIDWKILTSIFQKDLLVLLLIITEYEPNLFLLQITVISFFCGLFNLLPFPGLDGGFLWLLLLEKKIKNFKKFLKIITKIGFIALIIFQIILIYYIYFT